MAVSDQSTEGSVGVEILPSSFTAVCLSDDDVISWTRSAEFDRESGVVTQVTSFLEELTETAGKFSSVGIAVPGLIDKRTGRVAISLNIPEHTEVDLAAEILASTGIQAFIENDANAAAYGEYKIGAGRDSDNIFYATLGAGVGGAFILDGNIWRGKSGFAGEFGYVAINSEGMRLEDLASSANIVRRTRSRMRQDSTSSLSSVDEEVLSIRDILAAAGVEDGLAQMMLERTGEYVGTAIASVINLFNVETIVLGGVIVEAGPLLLDAVISRAKELSFGPSFADVSIVTGLLGRNAAATGAAFLGREASQGQFTKH